MTGFYTYPAPTRTTRKYLPEKFSCTSGGVHRCSGANEEKKPVTQVARLLGVHRATLYRALESTSDRA
ncbi:MULTISPECIES: helix-turn-helix domain-containing protein [Alphaproteobacteria]|uniref:helix-turn-helix domain-containing protein n=1 Tax=Alphaproteobacteria TaxID=28211 RepID=UPI0022A7631F|nr:helix-turn-helix domain-containing protein [Ciceribacter naphthalenivorans]